jgi:predicted nucleic acid-binding protein
VDAFDADVLIYAAEPGHPLGRRVLPLLGGDAPPAEAVPVGVGSVLLLPEILTKPVRAAADAESLALAALLARLDLLPVDAATARLAVVLGAAYGLRAADAVHLATAVAVGADRFVTNNSRDFTSDIVEIDVVHPVALPDADG